MGLDIFIEISHSLRVILPDYMSFLLYNNSKNTQTFPSESYPPFGVLSPESYPLNFIPWTGLMKYLKNHEGLDQGLELTLLHKASSVPGINLARHACPYWHGSRETAPDTASEISVAVQFKQWIKESETSETSELEDRKKKEHVKEQDMKKRQEQGGGESEKKFQ